jgi:hypothetical protein
MLRSARATSLGPLAVSSRCWRVEGEAATITDMKRTTLPQRAPATDIISYAGYRFPPDVISYAVWLYYRFPLSLRMVEGLLAARGIDLIYETVRRWSVKFGLGIARRIRSPALARGDKWHLDEVVVTINDRKHWLWRAVDQHGAALDVLVQSPARPARGPAAHAQISQETQSRAARVDHRQAQKLCRGEPGSGAQRRTSSAQGAEQLGGKRIWCK